MMTGRIARLFRLFGCLIVLLAFAGCWTVRESPPPATVIPSLPAGTDLKVQIAGFDATFTTYETAYGYATVHEFGPHYDYRGRYRGSGFGTTTYSTTEYIPRTESTPVYRDRATDALERAGCVLQAKDPQYRIEVRFDGPFGESGDVWAAAGWTLCTILTADFGAQGWSAKLKIHDLSSGKLVHEKDFNVRDEAVVWGPVPIFSPACASRTSGGVLKDNCLNALTDLAVAEAVSFLSGK